MRVLMQHYNNDLNAMLQAMQSKKSITNPCKECGENFEFSPFKQLEYEMMGFKPPKRCQKCIDNRNLNKLLSNMSEEQAAVFKSLFS